MTCAPRSGPDCTTRGHGSPPDFHSRLQQTSAPHHPPTLKQTAWQTCPKHLLPAMCCSQCVPKAQEGPSAAHLHSSAHRFARLQAGRLKHHSKGPAADHTLRAIVDCLAVRPCAGRCADHVARGVGVPLHNTSLKHLQAMGTPSGAALCCLAALEGGCLLPRAVLTLEGCTLELSAGSAASRAHEAGVLQRGVLCAGAVAALQLL